MRLRRGFTLIESIVTMAVIAAMAAVAVQVYDGVKRRSSDNTAIGVADQVAANLAHYAGVNTTYPPNQASVGWAGIMGASGLGSLAEFPANPPAVLSGGGFLVYTDPTGSTFQIEFAAQNGTGTVYCRDPNGLAALSTWSANGPWSGCP